MAGKGHSGHQSVDRHTFRYRGPADLQSSIPLLSDEAPDQSNLEAMALLRPDTQLAAINHPTLEIKRGVARTARSKCVARGPVPHRRTATSLGGLIAVKQARMLCRPGALRRHGPWLDLRSIGGKEDKFLLVRTEVRRNHLKRTAILPRPSRAHLYPGRAPADVDLYHPSSPSV